jgi:hypothetical protein
MTRILSLDHHQVVARALAHLTLVSQPHKFSPPDFVSKPVEYRLDESGLTGGDDPTAPHCADWSYGYRTLTADCAGFALYCVGLARYQPDYKGLNGAWLNTDSIIADAARQRRFFFELEARDEVRPGDLMVTRSTFALGVRVKAGHVGVIIRPSPSAAFEHLVVDCSPYHGRTTAIGLRKEPWARNYVIVRALNVKEPA